MQARTWLLLDRHLAHPFEVVELLRSNDRLAPKTIRNVYATLRALFRDALLEELVAVDACFLPRGALPSPREVSPSAARRKLSVFSREEIRLMLTDERVPADRRMLCALLLLTGMRHGEASGATLAGLGRLRASARGAERRDAKS
jgi:integrase